MCYLGWVLEDGARRPPSYFEGASVWIKIKARNAKYYEYYNTINKTTTKRQQNNKRTTRNNVVFIL